MNRKLIHIFAIGIILITALNLLSNWLAAYVEKSRNQVQHSQIIALSEQNQHLHQSLFIADLHTDSLLWNRNLAKKSDYGHVDIPRLIEGNVGLQVFSVVTKTPKNLNLNRNSDDTDNITLLAIAQLWPPSTWFSLYERANYQAKKLQKIAHKLPDTFSLIKSKQDFINYIQKREEKSNITAGLLSLEGGHALEGKIENLDRLYVNGFRIIGFAHFFDNALGGSAHGIHKGGITKFGKQVLHRMNELNMFVDISHASPKLMEDIFALSKRPILVSHTGIRGVCNSQRNLNDHQIKKVAQSGGVIGIGYWSAATCGKSIAGVVSSIRYVVDIVGIDHVALGSDFDGNVTVPFTTSNISQLTHALIQAGFNHNQIEKIMGENIKKLFLVNLPNN